MAATSEQQSSEAIYDVLSDQQRHEVDTARERIRQAEAELEELEARADHRRRRYGELQRQLTDWRRHLDERLPELREEYLDGRAGLNDLVAHHRDLRVLEDLEADMHTLGRTSMAEWSRLVESCERQQGRPGRDITTARRVLARHGLDD